MPFQNDVSVNDFVVHQLDWADFDKLAEGTDDPQVISQLRKFERSRRLLLLRALMDRVSQEPKLCQPLPSLESSWELLIDIQEKNPDALERILAHPFTGSWLGHTLRLFQDQESNERSLWFDLGYFHALVAAAAVHAGIDFEAELPAWDGRVILPTLGLAQLSSDFAQSTAKVSSVGGVVEISNETTCVQLPKITSEDAAGWLGLRRFSAQSGKYHLSLQLDDLDPYRGPYDPLPPLRLSTAELAKWKKALTQAWRLLADNLPSLACSLEAGLDSLVAKPAIPFRPSSKSNGEAFGSMVVARPQNGAFLAATLVHEFQHNKLNSLQYMARFCEDDSSERLYAPWRDDPRPVNGVLHGVYSFFGVAAFWRTQTKSPAGPTQRAAAFEFAYWRNATWKTLLALQDDSCVTPEGHRFLDKINNQLEPWQNEPVSDDAAALATAITVDHYAGWRIRHLRPPLETVSALTTAWLEKNKSFTISYPSENLSPTPIQAGTWRHARTTLIRLGLAESASEVSRVWKSVPKATQADFFYATDKYAEAADCYRAELVSDAYTPASWIGLGLSLFKISEESSTAKALLRYPELIREVHQKIRASTSQCPTPEYLATWISQFIE